MRPTLDNVHPFSRGDVAILADVGVPTIKRLSRALLNKPRSGAGRRLTYDLDDALRLRVAKELLRLNILTSSVLTLFRALETPSAPTAKPWSWLRTEEARREGATLVIVLGHPLGPDALHTGHAMLTTARDATSWLQTKRTVIVLDVSGFICELEARGNCLYRERAS